MELLDEKGRLFGIVNVVDALVVLVVLAMVVAGLALVVGGADEQEPTAGNESNGDNLTDSPPTPTTNETEVPTRYATFGYPTPLGSDATNVNYTDTIVPIAGGDNFTVTDIHRSVTSDGDAYVLVHVRYKGKPMVDGSVLYGGDSTQLEVNDYRIDASVLGVNRTQPALSPDRAHVTLTANVTEYVAEAIEAGPTTEVGGDRVATVTEVKREPTGDDRVEITLGVELTVWDRPSGPAFGGQPLRIDRRLTLLTDDLLVSGTVTAIGTDNPNEVGEE